MLMGMRVRASKDPASRRQPKRPGPGQSNARVNFEITQVSSPAKFNQRRWDSQLLKRAWAEVWGLPMDSASSSVSSRLSSSRLRGYISTPTEPNLEGCQSGWIFRQALCPFEIVSIDQPFVHSEKAIGRFGAAV